MAESSACPTVGRSTRCPGRSGRTATCRVPSRRRRRIGSVMPASAPLAVGRPMPSLAQPVWTRLAHEVLEELRALPAGCLPRARVAVTAAERGARRRPCRPERDGNGNQPRFLPMPFWFGREARSSSPSSQWPCSSIAALPLPIRPAELPAPCCAGVPRKPVLERLGVERAAASACRPWSSTGR